MTKYRIRLESGRVIGPFDKKQLFDLKAMGHIKGFEEAQVFPMGNWEGIEKFDFYSDLMDENKTVVTKQEAREETFLIDLTQLRNQKQELEIAALENETAAPIEDLTETVRFDSSEVKRQIGIQKNATAEVAPETVNEDDALETKDEDSQDRTLINPVAQEEIEKIRRQAQRSAELEAEALEEKRNEEIKAEKAAMALEIVLDHVPARADEVTQMIRLDREELMEVATETEQIIESELKAIDYKKSQEEDEEDSTEEDEENDKAKKKKIMILVLAAMAIIYALVFPDDKPEKPRFKHLDAKIAFPIPFDVADSQKSKVAYNRGLEYFNKGTYPDLIKAGSSFKESYENDLENMAALNFLVRSYAEQLKHSKNPQADTQMLFNLVQSKRPFLIQDPNGVIGLNLFYMAINKQDAAIDVVQKYLKLKPKDVTQDLFSIYLLSLIKKGKIDLARQFFQALDKAPQKNRYAYEALIEYLLLNQETSKALEYASDSVKNNPTNVPLMLTMAEILIDQEKIKDSVPLIKKAEKLNLDYNDQNRAKFYELKGMIYAFNKKTKEATAFFARSLKLEDSTSLRMNLAKLENTEGSSTATNNLINESKAIKLLMEAKAFYLKNNYELALSASAKATDAFPGHIPSELFLAKVQLRLGLAEQSLKTLTKLASKYPDDKNINLALIMAYIDTYKFNDAKNRIQNIAKSDYQESAEYASVNARLHLKMGDILQALSWLRSSTMLNPLNDEDIFLLAEIFLKKGNYDAARTLLNKCMELDPVNPDYRIAYARLIYETQDDMAAIGYLLSIDNDFGNNPKILSEIAVFYYRAGKLKDFQDYKAKLEKDHSSDKSLYEFLVKAALMDERTSEVPGLVEKLLSIEPGDLESMMIAGRVLFETGKLVEAAKWFKRVEDKLPSYPMVLYYQAKIDYLAGDLDLALKKLERNIKENGENDTDLVLIAQIKADKEEYIEAENLYKRAQKINARSYEAIVGLADLSTKRNNHDLALDLYKRATKLRSDEPVIHKKMGDVYRQIGQGALAIESYKMYLEMDPESSHKRNLESYIQLMQ